MQLPKDFSHIAARGGGEFFDGDREGNPGPDQTTKMVVQARLLTEGQTHGAKFVVQTTESKGQTPPVIEPDETYMRAALSEAEKGVGLTSPNPAVGAVIVKDGKLIARGYHRKAGGPHAEVEAIRALARPEDARGATIYVTLEPCSTHGRTPPCTDAILHAGLERVVMGAMDPNPRHVGRAETLL
ncbi:MAG: bifunctional diaminohydroxyphosphoribosylaminopyrimidine deaminase/5-amino-6-(5-phosphoribosylamino)uracil reductase RibD, partial [Chthoniobacteraceae bacterium]